MFGIYSHGGAAGFFYAENRTRVRFEKLFQRLAEKTDEVKLEYDSLKKYNPDFFTAELKFNEIDEILFTLSQGDLTKYPVLRNTQRKLLYETYYRLQVNKLNEMIDTVAYMGSIKD